MPVDLANEEHLLLLTTVVYLARDTDEALRALNEGLRCSAASSCGSVGAGVPRRVRLLGSKWHWGISVQMTSTRAKKSPVNYNYISTWLIRAEGLVCICARLWRAHARLCARLKNISPKVPPSARQWRAYWF